MDAYGSGIGEILRFSRRAPCEPRVIGQKRVGQWFLLLVGAAFIMCGLTCAGAEPASTSGPETLLEIRSSKEFPRHSEGDIIELKDGRLALVWTRFRGGADDHNAADLAMRVSSDGGKNWSADRILLPSEGKMNVMSVTLRRIKGDILLFYLRKDSPNTLCNLYVRRSTDELDTLSSPTRVTLVDGYHCVNNDRVVELSSGRLIVPASLHTDLSTSGTPTGFAAKGQMVVYYSDDQGHTWARTPDPIVPISERKLELQEPGIVELADGRLWMFIRTPYGFQYGCYSSDGGMHWTEPKPTSLASPQSPASIERIPGSNDLLCVWNDHTGNHPFKPHMRVPWCVTTSSDGGKTWRPSKALETSLDGGFCYGSITFVGQRVLVSYSGGDTPQQALNTLRIKSFPLSWVHGQ